MLLKKASKKSRDRFSQQPSRNAHRTPVGRKRDHEYAVFQEHDARNLLTTSVESGSVTSSISSAIAAILSSGTQFSVDAAIITLSPGIISPSSRAKYCFTPRRDVSNAVETEDGKFTQSILFGHNWGASPIARSPIGGGVNPSIRSTPDLLQIPACSPCLRSIPEREYELPK